MSTFCKVFVIFRYLRELVTGIKSLAVADLRGLELWIHNGEREYSLYAAIKARRQQTSLAALTTTADLHCVGKWKFFSLIDMSCVCEGIMCWGSVSQSRDYSLEGNVVNSTETAREVGEIIEPEVSGTGINLLQKEQPSRWRSKIWKYKPQSFFLFFVS